MQETFEKMPLLTAVQNKDNLKNPDQPNGIVFFKNMPEDVRFVIGNYLTPKDLNNLKQVSRDFCGPINKTNYKKDWSQHAFFKLMTPSREACVRCSDSRNPMVEQIV